MNDLVPYRARLADERMGGDVRAKGVVRGSRAVQMAIEWTDVRLRNVRKTLLGRGRDRVHRFGGGKAKSFGYA